MEYLVKKPACSKNIFRAPSLKQKNTQLEYLKQWLESQLKAWVKQRDNISTNNQYGLLEKHIAKGRVFMLKEMLRQLKGLMEK